MSGVPAGSRIGPFDVGMSDPDVLDSFERYVDRILRSDLAGDREGGTPHGSRGSLAVAWLRGRRSARRTNRGTLPLSGLQGERPRED